MGAQQCDCIKTTQTLKIINFVCSLLYHSYLDKKKKKKKKTLGIRSQGSKLVNN